MQIKVDLGRSINQLSFHESIKEKIRSTLMFQLRKELKEAGFEFLRRMDRTRMFLGKNIISQRLMKAIFSALPFDFISATANYVAVKPV